MGGHRRAALLGQPLFTGAVALLAVNDAILKPTFGTWWTGKLSDAAGVVVLTIVLAVATGHAGLGGILAAAALSAIKVHPTAAEQAATIIGGETRQDATDLFALVVIAPVVRHVRARLIDGSQRPVDGRVSAQLLDWSRSLPSPPRAAPTRASMRSSSMDRLCTPPPGNSSASSAGL